MTRYVTLIAITTASRFSDEELEAVRQAADKEAVRQTGASNVYVVSGVGTTQVAS